MTAAAGLVRRMRACCLRCRTYGNLLVERGQYWFTVRCPICGPVRREYGYGVQAFEARMRRAEQEVRG